MAPPPAAPVTDDTAAIAGNQGGALPITTNPNVTNDGVVASAGGAVEAQPAPAPAAPAVAPAPVATPAPVTAAPLLPKPAKPKPAPTVVAAADANAPLDLTPGVPPAEAQGGAADGVLVRFPRSGRRTPRAPPTATCRPRYPNILGKYDVNLPAGPTCPIAARSTACGSGRSRPPTRSASATT
ncbi:MAG: hypothetical protein WDM84_10025 [Bauldia sp.]